MITIQSAIKHMHEGYVKEQCKQNYQHDENITELYAEIYRACRDTFHEDNSATLKQFLTECFNKSLEQLD